MGRRATHFRVSFHLFHSDDVGRDAQWLQCNHVTKKRTWLEFMAPALPQREFSPHALNILFILVLIFYYYFNMNLSVPFVFISCYTCYGKFWEQTAVPSDNSRVYHCPVIFGQQTICFQCSAVIQLLVFQPLNFTLVSQLWLRVLACFIWSLCYRACEGGCASATLSQWG